MVKYKIDIRLRIFNKALEEAAIMMNIAANVRAIDIVKSELLSEIAKLYRTLSEYEDAPIYDEVLEELASINAMSYILAKRLGMEFECVDDKMLMLLSTAVQNGHELEVEFSDMSKLADYVRGR